ncbi:hypothetical protein [Albibacterium profundi]|uniref:Uncharacterized protein n=1 Tax=Albibacterium profundi TaxID=3134906 RepID=A0ABV5CAG3_9SPHI
MLRDKRLLLCILFGLVHSLCFAQNVDDEVTLNLSDTTVTLKSVTITAERISPLERYQANKEAYKSIFWKGDREDMIQVAPLGVAVNINKLFSALSNEGKDARRLQKMLESEYEMEEVDSFFNKPLVKEVTGLDGNELNDFMLKYRPDYDWIKSASHYDLILYIKEKFKELSDL